MDVRETAGADCAWCGCVHDRCAFWLRFAKCEFWLVLVYAFAGSAVVSYSYSVLGIDDPLTSTLWKS